jgi:acetolactate synthase-1/3 small subunit
VHKVVDLTEHGPHVERELALVKVAGSGDHRIEALRLAELYRARVVDATTKSFVFELTGGTNKIDKFIELMGEVGLVEIARTGVVAMARGRDTA